MPRLLIVKTSSLGDVIHNLPILADIRAHYPDMQFDWMVEEAFADVPALHPAVSEVIPVAVRRWRRHLLELQTWREMAAFRKVLQAQSYEKVIDTQGLLKSACIAALAHGELHGQDRSCAREPLAALFYRHRHSVPRGQHAVTRNRQLVALAMGYPMPTTSPDYGLRHADTRPVAGLPATYLVALHATSRASKLWPVDHWIAFGKALAGRGLALVLPWGSASEQVRAQTIAAAVPGAMVPPRLGIAQLATVLAGSAAAVGVDTGLVHLAAALDLPTVALYTDTDPTLTGVMGPDPARFRNLGGVGQIPGSEAVLAALHQVAKI